MTTISGSSAGPGGPPGRRDLGELLLEEHLITEGVLRAARRLAKRERMPVVVVLLEEEHLSEDQLVDVLSRRIKLPVVDPARIPIDEDVLRRLPYDLAEKHRVLPLAVLPTSPGAECRLRVAMADPLDREALEELHRVTGCHIEPVIAPVQALADAIRYRYRGTITHKMSRSSRERAVESPDTPPAIIAPRRAGRDADEAVTQPLTRIDEDVSTDLRLRALIGVLIDTGVITEQGYAEALRKLLKDG